MTTYDYFDKAEAVQRAFDEGRRVEVLPKNSTRWREEPTPRGDERLLASLIAYGDQYRAPKPAEPAEGRMDATVNKLLTDCYKAMTWAMAVIDPDEGPGREHSNASNALADCRVRIENLRALQAGLTKNEFGIPITTPTAERDDWHEQEIRNLSRSPEGDAVVASLTAERQVGGVGDAEWREFLGKLVRMEWMAWAREQPSPKPSWLQPWDALTEPEREVDRRIGERIYNMAIGGLAATSQEDPAA